MNFTYNELSTVYSLFRQKKYSFSFFGNFNPKGKVFLRHDVDNSITKALEMAHFETALGLASTFFIQPDNDFYNPLSQKAAENINRIAELGHKIGLHISPSNCQNAEKLREFIERTFKYFSHVFPLDRTFSFHRPASFDGWQSIEVPGFTNTYHSKYFKEIYYFSDSNRREFLVPGFFDVPSTGKSIQLLTHPAWWSERGCSAEETMSYLVTERKEGTEESLGVNTQIFSELLKRRVKIKRRDLNGK